MNHLHMYGPFSLGIYGDGRRWYVMDDFGNLVKVTLKDHIFNLELFNMMYANLIGTL